MSSQGYVMVTATGLVKEFDRTPIAPADSEVLEQEVPGIGGGIDQSREGQAGRVEGGGRRFDLRDHQGAGVVDGTVGGCPVLGPPDLLRESCVAALLAALHIWL